MNRRPLYLVTGEVPSLPAVTPANVATKMRELHHRLMECVEDAHRIEADMFDLAVQGALREYASVWAEATEATDSVRDVLTRSVVNSLPFQIENASEWDQLLRRFTDAPLDVIVGSMTSSYNRVTDASYGGYGPRVNNRITDATRSGHNTRTED
jgi:hypothetical protein